MKELVMILAVILIPGGLIFWVINRIARKRTDSIIARIKARGVTTYRIEGDPMGVRRVAVKVDKSSDDC